VEKWIGGWTDRKKLHSPNFIFKLAINIWVCTWTANSPGKTIYTRKENKWI
jgi:hypothetical protein